MDQHYASSPPDANVTDEVLERMRRVDHLVRQWTDPAFRAQIDPQEPEIVGPPTRTLIQRIRCWI
ncbi:MAG TPA: hypothetical protein VE871_11455 [Longimicrobium sp.]|nr:hypothetical protein [Longimicrobium sp.]